MASANLAHPVKKSRRKMFRFAPETSQVVVVGWVLSRDDFSEEEKSNYWYSKETHETMRSSARTSIDTVRAKKGGDIIDLIDDSYKFAKDVVGCLKVDAIEEILQDPSSHTRRLEDWSAKGHDACGLERTLSQLQHLERRADYMRLSRYVVNTSRVKGTVEEIAEVATRFSLTSRVYARMVGHAEAHALLNAGRAPRESKAALHYARRKAVRCHTMVPPMESKASRTPLTQKRPVSPLKRSTWCRLMRLGNKTVTNV
jgi:hypothetical protein